MRSPIAKVGMVFAALIVLTLVVLVLGIRRQLGVSCEVCITFHGRQSCRSAAGSTPEEARRTAHENACALIASGMTETVSCQNTPADSITCSDP